jgi:hypothetical protein
MATGETPSEERAALVDGFRRGEFRALVNCNLFTTGMDVADIDCIVLLRPTQSKGLLIQQLGRGTRQTAGKEDCFILDLSGNLARHIPLDAIHDLHRSPERVKLDEVVALKKKKARQLAHETTASRLDPMAEDTPTLTLPVDAVYYEVALSRNPAQAGKRLLKVTYRLRSAVHKWVTSWVCHEYAGGARFHAAQWFQRRSRPMPNTAEQAYSEAKAGAYPTPQAVVVRQDGKYLRVILEQFAETEG